MRFRPNHRLTAAVLYLLAAISQFGILVVLFDIGGSDGLSYLLTEESPARHVVAYLLVAGFISLGVTAVLILIRHTSRTVKVWLLAIATLQLIGGLVFAQITVISTAIAFGFLVGYCRARIA